MNAGNMDRKIVIQSLTDFGGGNKQWDTFATVWANKRILTGREFYAAQQRQSETNVVFEIWFLENVNSSMRISYDNKYYDILYLEEIGRREGLKLFCIEKEERDQW